MLKKLLCKSVIIFILVIGAITLLQSAVYAQVEAECWALVVGISDYNDNHIKDRPGIDAERVYEQIRGFWGEDHVKLLLDGQARKQDIKDSISEWLDNKEGTNDTILVFLSGHGNSRYFAPHDSLYVSYNNDISTNELNNWLDTLESRKQIIILNSCQSGSFIQSLAKGGRVILTSCAENEDSWGSTLNGPVFTFYVSNGLKDLDQVDSNRNGEVSIEEIFNYASPHTTSKVKTWQEIQHPQINDGYTGDLNIFAKLEIRSQHGQIKGGGWYGLNKPVTISVAPSMENDNTATRHVFTGWQSAETTLPNELQTSLTLEKATTITALWKTQYKLTLSSQFGDPKWDDWHDAGSEATISITPIIDHEDGSRHVFAGWQQAGIKTTESQSKIIMDSPKTIIVTWKLQYYLALKTNPAGVTSLSGEGWYDAGSLVTVGPAPDAVPVNAGTRYVLQDLNISGNDISGNGTAIIMDSPKKITANFKLQHYLTLKSVPSEVTSIGGEGWYDADSLVTVGPANEAVPVDDGTRYVFQIWDAGDNDVSDRSIVLKMDSAKNVTAKYQTQYYLVVQESDGISEASGWHPAGTEVSVSAPSSKGIFIRQVFDGWNGDINGKTVKMDAPKTISANFRTDYSRLFALFAVVLAVLVSLIFMLRRKVIKVRTAPAKMVGESTTPLVSENCAKLVLPDNSEILIIESDKYIGRKDFDKAVLPETLKHISRSHFLLISEKNRYYIEDANSTNGTRAGGVEIKGKGRYELKDGDQIVVAGSVPLTFRNGVCPKTSLTY